jgi:glycosyltransferase involved in cell wall biosynthesis
MVEHRSTPRLVSVVVPARNAVGTLAEQLAALRQQDYAGAWDVVVADNGSTDGTADLARRWAATLPLRVVDASAQRGASFARNRGWRSASGDLIAFCDADDVVAPHWLGGLVDAARRADLVGGPYEFRRLNAAAGGSWWNGESLPVGLHFLPFIVGGNFAVWTDVLAALGGFNEAYARQEDVELSWRAQCASLRLGFASDAVVHCRYRRGLLSVARQGYHDGFTEPHLYRDFRAAGMPPATAWRFPRLVGKLVMAAPGSLTSRTRRALWIRNACLQLGRLAGSVRYRVLYL